MMWLIYIMGALLGLILHSGRQQKVYSFATITLGTLAAGTAIVGATRLDGSREQGCKMRDIFGKFTWEGKTVGDGPVYYGLAPSSMTTALIAQVFNADPQSIFDETSTEEAMRRLIVVGEMPLNQAAAINEDDHWHKIMWPTSWDFPEGEGLNIFVFNREGGALASGALLHFDGMFNTTWLED